MLLPIALLLGSVQAVQELAPNDLAEPADAWQDCLVKNLARYAGAREPADIVVDATLASCRKEQRAAMETIKEARIRAGFRTDYGTMKSLEEENLRAKKDWMLPAVLEMKVKGIAPN